MEEATDVVGFGDYALDTKVGEGPRGTVWRAVHRASGRQVAVKELAPALRGDEVFMTAYRALVTKLVDLDEHRNRVPVLACLEDTERVWVVEPWVDGRRLDLIAANGGLTPEESVAVVAGVLAGLASAKEIVHGDVRPENIVVAADGTPLVTDFGIPVPPDPDKDGDGDTFRSAEAVRGDRLDARSDVYSAGAVLHELLGDTPELTVPAATPETDAAAAGDADTAAAAAPAAAPVPKLSQAGKKLSRLVQRALSEDPKKRPARAATFRASLEKLAGECFGDGWQEKAVAGLAGTAVAPRPVATRVGADDEDPGPTPLATRLSRRHRRPIPHTTVLGLALAILVLLGVATVTVDRRTGDSLSRTARPSAQATPAEVAGSDIAGRWAVIISVVESTGFFDSSSGTAAVKAYEISSDCSKTPCDYRLTVVGSPGEFALPRVGEDYVLKEQGPNDCIDLESGAVRVPGGGVATVEVKLRPTAARKNADGRWMATAFEGGVVTTFESQNPECGGGSGVQRTALTGTRQ
ncbi:MAG: eukaryotic-like serine/threonine-protein kinase [Actinomycetota bacterium]|nr:eukaryotic-like serine/threonine-protein kinase [Actinomycetota bacterium]